ncbi:MAG: GNAT family N-acetyltransferase [Actinomycetota bacterium]
MLEIERIEAGGWRLYRDLRLASLGDAQHAFGSRLESERRRSEFGWREHLARRTQFVALADGRRPVGTVGARPDGETETELVSMWVAPEARRTGVADRLVEAVIDEATVLGSVGVVLWVSDGNDAAERLYARHGFARTGRIQPIDDDDLARGTEFEMRLPVSGA